MINGKERNNPSLRSLADHATPRGALPDNNILWPATMSSAVSPSGAPSNADGI